MLLRRMKRPTSLPLLPDCQRPSYRYSDLLQTQGPIIYSNDSLMSNVYRWVNRSALKLRDVESQKSTLCLQRAIHHYLEFITCW
jgi:hypothetical protein